MRKINGIWLMLLLGWLVISFFGCNSARDPMKMAIEPPELVFTPVVSQAPPRGTIWPGENGKNMLFADKKARYLNDIVTIIVRETSKAENLATTNTGRTGSATAGISSLLGIDRSLIDSNRNLSPKIEIGGSATNTLKGTGNTSREGKLEARITARVVRVFDNGNLLLEGRRQILVNAENQFIIISGIVRPEDITAENTVASQHIAEARIIFTGQGVINDKMRPGWLTRTLDWVWPF
jgi:flagellar L-ring protein precursor FlgH